MARRILYALLCVLFCAAMIPEAASSTIPKAAVTAKLSNAPGCEFGIPSV